MPKLSGLFGRIADQIHHARRVYRNHALIMDLHEKFNASKDDTNKAVIATQIGSLMESQADHLDASWLARATTSLPPLTEIRSEAVDWFVLSDHLFIKAGRR